jgi:hypothetical protein
MNKDRLLRELGHLAREEERAERARLDERWDRLAAGTLTPEEEAELRALAETSPEAREAWEAFRPLGPEFQARVVEKISAELQKEEPWWRLLWFRPAARIGGWVTAAATAAAVVVRFMQPPAPIPGYQIAVKGGSSEMREEEEEAVRLAPGDRCEVLLRPDTAVARAKSLKAQCFLVRGGERRPMEVEKIHIESTGVIKLEGSIPHDLQAGTWTFLAVVGRPRSLPDPAELQSLAARGEVRQRDWVAVSQDILIQPRGP